MQPTLSSTHSNRCKKCSDQSKTKSLKPGAHSFVVRLTFPCIPNANWLRQSLHTLPKRNILFHLFDAVSYMWGLFYVIIIQRFKIRIFKVCSSAHNLRVFTEIYRNLLWVMWCEYQWYICDQSVHFTYWNLHLKTHSI